MAEEMQMESQQNEGEQLQSEDTIVEQTPQTIEDTAREQGWKPKEEFSGDSSKWVSAETFVAKGELIDRIESLGKKLKDNDKTIAMLKEHHAKVKDTEFKNAVAFLKSQKKAAYESGDVDKIIEMDDRIAEVKETQRLQAVQEQQQPASNADFQSWASENKWYDKNSEMRADADQFGAAYFSNNPQKTPMEVLDYVTKKIKKVYPEEFSNLNRNRPSGVEGSGGSSRAASSRDNFTLSAEETQVMNTFTRNGIMTKDEYIKQIKAMRG